MGQQQSKDELLYQQVNYGNVEGIKSLCSDGAGLEWVDREGKTPLIVACMNPELHDVAKTLIELGANVNAYHPGRHAGTPLHHAAKRGLERTVKLLLFHGANLLVLNGDCQTPLDIARAKGFSNVVRAIENHICLFSGWLREFYGPGFLEVLAPQLVSSKVWVVVLPCGSRNLSKPFKLELAIYPSLQDAQPRAIISLWKANMEEPKYHQRDPSVTIFDNSNISRGRRRRRSDCTSPSRETRREARREARRKPRAFRQTQIKLAPGKENDKQQLEWFCNACKGIPQAMHPTFLHSTQAPVTATGLPSREDLELANAAMERPPRFDTHLSSEAAASTSGSTSLGTPVAPVPSSASSSGWTVHEAGPNGNSTQHIHIQNNIPAVQISHDAPASFPTAPPTADDIVEDGPIHYPSIDSSPIDLPSPTVDNWPATAGERKDDGVASSSCVICLDAPVEGACIPCGHMAGCMSCLNEIQAKKWGCPVCRAKIDQVTRLYAV